MGADPEPQQPIFNLDRKRPIAEPDARRPEAADRLEARRGVLWIALQKFVIPVGQQNLVPPMPK